MVYKSTLRGISISKNETHEVVTGTEKRLTQNHDTSPGPVKVFSKKEIKEFQEKKNNEEDGGDEN